MRRSGCDNHDYVTVRHCRSQVSTDIGESAKTAYLVAKLNTSSILEGSDLSQIGEIKYVQSEKVKEEAKKGIKPFGKIHDLIIDALGEDYKGSIYDYDESDVTGGKYPTVTPAVWSFRTDVVRIVNHVGEVQQVVDPLPA